jgi:hypothetical protein
MAFPAPYPIPPEPHALPVAPEEDILMAQWTQVAGYVQPELLDRIDFDFESLDMLFPWEQGGMHPEPSLSLATVL